jgi:hypothetical protein
MAGLSCGFAANRAAVNMASSFCIDDRLSPDQWNFSLQQAVEGSRSANLWWC